MKPSKSEDTEVDRGSMMESAGNAVRRMSASILSYVPVTSSTEKPADAAAMAAVHLRPRTSSFADPAAEASADSNISYYTADPEASALHHRSRTSSTEQVSMKPSKSEDTDESAGSTVRRISAGLLSYVPVTSGAETAVATPDPAAMAALHLRPRTSSFADPAVGASADSVSASKDIDAQAVAPN